ncbi:monocarboxylate transporter 13-like [Glandiceps talaboti]
MADCGWKWVVLFSCHIATMLSFGSAFSLGVFVSEFQRYFNSTASESAVVGSLAIAMTSFGAPVSMVMMKKFGYRMTVIIAGGVSAVGWLASSFATSTTYLVFTCGFVTGMANGMAFPTVITAVNHYFTRRLALVNGFVFAGLALAMLILPPFHQILIDFYGWRGACLIHSAFHSHLIVCGALIRPPPLPPPPPPPPPPQVTETLKTAKSKVDDDHDDSSKNDLRSGSNQLVRVSNCTSIGYDNVVFQNGSSNDTSGVDRVSIGVNTGDETPGSGDDVLEFGRLVINQDVESTITRSDNPDKAKRASTVNIRQNSIGGNRCCTMLRYIQRSDLSMLWRNPPYAMVCFASFCNGFGVTSLMVHIIIGRSLQLNITELEAATLVSMVGISSLIARLTHGWIVDFKCISYGHAYALTIGVCGAATLLMPVATTYEQMAPFCIIVGLTSGTFNPLTTVVIRDHVGLQKLSSGVGLGLPFLGLGDIAGSVLTGMVYDITGNYNYPCYMAGAVDFLGAIVLLPENYAKRWMNRKAEKTRGKNLE